MLDGNKKMWYSGYRIKKEVIKMAIERIYDETTTEYFRMLLFKEVANAILYGTHKYLSIADMYFDYGQDWKYTGLLMNNFETGRDYQAFCPRDYKLIITCDSVEKIKEMATYYATKQSNFEWDYRDSLFEKFE